MASKSFEFKSKSLSTVVLELYEYSKESFSSDLREKIALCPSMFKGLPVVIDLGGLKNEIDPAEICEEVQVNGLTLVAFRGGDDELAARVESLGMPHIKSSAVSVGDAVKKVSGTARPKQKMLVKTVVEERLVAKPSMVINRPIRGGEQIYAEGCDLIILNQVNTGAEVLSDGNIHIYGSLRGKALAGIKGDESARIFVSKLEADMVSVAGRFLLAEQIEQSMKEVPVQVCFSDDDIQIKHL